MKIIKPDNLGLLYRALQMSSGKLLSLGLMGMFSLDRSSLADLLSEQVLWKNSEAAIGSDGILDAGWPKPAGEFLVYGACHAPNATPVPQINVTAGIGGIRKTLAVFGDRHFSALRGISAAQPFRRMEIGPKQSFGGEGFADNPKGCGFAAIKDAAGAPLHPLPNVESPAALIVSSSDRPQPAGFWAVPPEAPQRTKLLGSFDAQWLKKTWPHMPVDTQPAYFHSAPPDQRLAAYFKGDEAIEIMHMHPQHATINARLPRLRARCFVNRKIAGGEIFSEIDTRAETVWLFPELECGIVLYRALAEIADSDADDVLHVMAEWESMDNAPLSFEHYHEIFKRQLPGAGKAVETDTALPAEILVAATPAPQAAAMQAPSIPPAAAAAPATVNPELTAVVDQMERDAQALMKKYGLTEKDVERLTKPAAQPAMPDLNLEQMVAKVEADSQALLKQHGLTAADVEKYVRPAVPKAAEPADLAGAFRQLDSTSTEMMQKSGVTPASLKQVVGGQPGTENLLAALNLPAVDVESLIASLAALNPPAAKPAAPIALAAPPIPEPELKIPEPPPPAPQMTRELVIERHAAKLGFKEMDLSGLDLSGLDLAGADFTKALLEKTGFAKSRLNGADFSGALLREADFGAADLSAAKLIGASADTANLRDAVLAKSDLSGADFTNADFGNADLHQAHLIGGVFNGAKMAKLRAAACDATGARFEEADLTQADFSGAQLAAAKFNQALLGQGNLSKAKCRDAEFYGVQAVAAIFSDADLQASRADASSQFGTAIFSRARLVRAAWEGVMIGGAQFGDAILDDADFSKAQARAALFTRASAKGAKFDKADLSAADMTGINLFKGSLRQATLHTTLLRKANLYGVDFLDTAPTIASLEGSNIDRTVLQFRPAVV
jgi:uncharacterized protein YjbI with pentapeptide repeats